MNRLLSQLLTAYALYTLSGAGVVVIFVAMAAWFIWDIYGWIALGAYFFVLWLLFELACKAIADLLLRKTPHMWGRPSLPADREPKEPPKPRQKRHGY